MYKLQHFIFSFFSRKRFCRGSVMLPAIITMVMLSYASLSLVQLQSSTLIDAANHAKNEKTKQLFLAGVEYTKAKLNIGLKPDTNGDKPLGDGTIWINSIPNASTVSIHGKINPHKTAGDIITDFSNDCFDPKTGYAITPGVNEIEISNVQFKKSCHDRLILNSMRISWTNSQLSQKVTHIQYQGSPIYDGIGPPTVGTPIGGALSNDMIDSENIIVTNSENHVINYITISFTENSPIVSPTTFTITFFFADGSSYTRDYIY